MSIIFMWEEKNVLKLMVKKYIFYSFFLYGSLFLMSPVYCGQVISKPKILPVFAKQYCQEDFLLVLASLEQKKLHPKYL